MAAISLSACKTTIPVLNSGRSVIKYSIISVCGVMG